MLLERERERFPSAHPDGAGARAGGGQRILYRDLICISRLPLIIYIFFYYSVIATVMVISTIVYCIVFHVLHILVGCARNFLFM